MVRSQQLVVGTKCDAAQARNVTQAAVLPAIESPKELEATLGDLNKMKAIKQRACYPPLSTRHSPLAPLVPYSLLLTTYTLCMLL